MSTQRMSRLLVVLLVAAVLFIAGGARDVGAQGAAVPNVGGAYGAGTVENLGQWPAEAFYRLNAGGATVWLRNAGFVYQMVDPSALTAGDDLEAPVAPPDAPAGPQGAVDLPQHSVFVNFVDGYPSAFENVGPLPGEYNWFIGDTEVTGARGYSAVTYRELYSGINMYVVDGPLASKGSLIKTTYEVMPGVDPSAIVMQYEGADDMYIENGNLVIQTGLGPIVEKKPVAYQMVDGQSEPLTAEYVLSGNEVRFSVTGRDPNARLFIDPYVFFLGEITGTSTDYFGEMHRDASGNLYVTGYTSSTDFPTLAGYQMAVSTTPDLFAAKVNGQWNWRGLGDLPGRDVIRLRRRLGPGLRQLALARLEHDVQHRLARHTDPHRRPRQLRHRRVPPV